MQITVARFFSDNSTHIHLGEGGVLVLLSDNCDFRMSQMEKSSLEAATRTHLQCDLVSSCSIFCLLRHSSFLTLFQTWFLKSNLKMQ